MIGTVEIVDCVRNAKSPWALPRKWQLVLANPMPLRSPIPFRGSLGSFEVPDKLLPRRHRG